LLDDVTRPKSKKKSNSNGYVLQPPKSNAIFDEGVCNGGGISRKHVYFKSTGNSQRRQLGTEGCAIAASIEKKGAFDIRSFCVTAGVIDSSHMQHDW
jgi:hypothetical protein